MRLTVHIGPHKTGTTALQSAFARGARVLRKHGVLYPRSNWMHPAQHRLAFALKGKRIPGTDNAPDRKCEVAALKRALARYSSDQVFLSSEEFFATPPEELEWFRNALDVDTIDILVFLRRPDRFLVSCYNQKVRQPGNGFDAPMRRFLRNPSLIAPEINYLTHLSNWADVFGNDAVALKTYEAAPPLAQALFQLGLPADLLPDIPSVNRSVPGAVVEAVRHAKLAGLSAKHQRKVLEHATLVFAKSAPFNLSNEDRVSIIQQFEASNDRLFKRFGQKNPYTVQAFQPEPEEPHPNLTIGDVMLLVEHLL